MYLQWQLFVVVVKSIFRVLLLRIVPPLPHVWEADFHCSLCFTVPSKWLETPPATQVLSCVYPPPLVLVRLDKTAQEMDVEAKNDCLVSVTLVSSWERWGPCWWIWDSFQVWHFVLTYTLLRAVTDLLWETVHLIPHLPSGVVKGSWWSEGGKLRKILLKWPESLGNLWRKHQVSMASPETFVQTFFSFPSLPN